jgi:hypothetical protein
MNEQTSSRVARAFGSLLLFRLPNRFLDALLTSAVGLLVIWSRFGLLANGPWEWDETIFARGILKFELAAHFPHPPGFPGWLAIGHVVDLLTGDPLLALQLASAGLSVAALWLLAALGRRVAPPAVAVAAALVVMAAPGPWLFAVRGFSSTPAAVFALAAAAFAANGLEGRRPTAFTLLVTASFLVRPNLLPTLGALWLGFGLDVRPRQRLVPGVLAGTGAVALAVAVMVRAEGGWDAFVEPFIVHTQRHVARLGENAGGFADLGLVKGLGGPVPATILVLAAAFGIVVWARRAGKRGAWLWAFVLVAAVAQMMWLQGRTGTRYAVGVQMALAPLLAAAATAAPAGWVGLMAIGGWLGHGSLPLLMEQHRTEFPAWSAVRESRAEALVGGQTVVLEPELYPFASYLWHLEDRRGETNPPWVLSPWNPGPWSGIDGPWVLATVHRHLYPDALYGRERHWGGISDALRALTHDRFFDAWAIEEAPLPLSGWWPAEREPDGTVFMWGGVETSMLLPPLAEDTELGIALRAAPGSAPVVIEIDGIEVARVAAAGGGQCRWLKIPPPAIGRISTLHMTRSEFYGPGGGDGRQLAVQLFEIRAITRGVGWEAQVSRHWLREILQIEVEGMYGAESFAGHGDGAWLAPRAVLRLPGETGVLGFRMWAPRATSPRTLMKVAGRIAAGPLDLGTPAATVEIEVLPGDAINGRVEVEILSEPYVPLEAGGDDARELGVVLSQIAVEPRGDGP